MNRWFSDPGAWSAMLTLKAVDVSTAVARILSLSGCNLLLGLVVYLAEEEGNDMNKWIGHLPGRNVPGKTEEEGRFS